jgi:hypothetical protein
MKKVIVVLIVVSALMATACSQYTCPAYTKAYQKEVRKANI